ncbi:hypothetical protein OOT46_13340 [Aquabacterium sp. A7-Y]|uniref:ankyrin repeat domain-containing protein n=1 Tax=Aquabacterium sp. A7-Y TaxID=1349605 RepID=UPI00223D0FCC|nr:ankyrin repeat domain-containing protein [Aquabacterium sp. A7-Y]MCW7538826.1 hypothetical protein [Aquabacterium sp. A7-Y]
MLKWAGAAALVVLVGGVGYIVQGLRTADILMLQACSEVERAPIAWTCRQGLYRFHPTREEVAHLNTVAGALFTVDQTTEENGRRLLKHFIDAGVDVNAADQRVPAKWTALHVMASEPNPLAVRLLLEHGARPDVKDAQGRTPADLARARQAKSQNAAYAEVIDMLDAKAGSR